MTYRNVRRAAGMALTLALSCSVYDSSLLGGNAGGSALLMGGNGGGGASGTVVSGGSAGRVADAGSEAGEAGTAAEGGTLAQGGAVAQGGAGGAGKAGEPGGTSGAPSEAGKGGSAGASASGAGGTAGTGGSAGNSGGGTTSGGTAGAPSTGGSAGAVVVPANGCASLSVPLTASTHKAHFVITLGSNTNFSAATIGMHVYVKAGVGGVIANYVQDSSYLLLENSKLTELSTLSGWQTLTWNVGAQGAGTTGINLSGISRIGIDISAAPDAAWSNPTLVYVDSITVTSPALSFSFDTSSTVNTTLQPGDVGGQVLWGNGYSGDTTASNVALGWLASCP